MAAETSARRKRDRREAGANRTGDTWVAKRLCPSGEEMALEVSVVQFAESRALELEALSQAVESVGGTKLAFQRLQRHMRRRAMSHNIRRVPRRLRQRVQAELERRDKKGVKKRPSRQHRRRPSNLLSEYQLRQQRRAWLETHIWHAKRFKMTEAWGYRLPLHPSDKSLRACYRATTQHCLLQDISYECCIELCGRREVLTQALAHVSSRDTGLTFAARATASGRRWGEAMLYTCRCYPHGAVAPVMYLWQAEGALTWENTQQRGEQALWIWCHPASYCAVWTQLLRACTLLTQGGEGTTGQPGGQSGVKGQALPPGGTEVQVGQIKVRSLKDQLVRFRLTGPTSTLVLAEALKPAVLCPRTSNNSECSSIGGSGDGDRTVSRQEARLVAPDNSSEHSGVDGSGDGDRTVGGQATRPAAASGNHGERLAPWWQWYYANREAVCELQNQEAAWERVVKCGSPAHLPPRIVLALTVRDPRILLPPTRNRVTLCDAGGLQHNQVAQGQSTGSNLSGMWVRVPPWSLTTVTVIIFSLAADTLTWDQLPGTVSCSPLWDGAVRYNVSATKLSEQEFNRRRSQLLTLGTTLELGDQESQVPVLLLQQPGVQQPSGTGRSVQAVSATLGLGSGWDVVLPRRWGMAFWVALVYRGARVGGLREARGTAASCGVQHFPHDFPDTEAGQKQQQEAGQALIDKHQRRPPAKRCNYARLGVPAPFFSPYAQLAKEWSTRAEELIARPEGAKSMTNRKLDMDSRAVQSTGELMASPEEEKSMASRKPDTGTTGVQSTKEQITGTIGAQSTRENDAFGSPSQAMGSHEDLHRAAGIAGSKQVTGGGLISRSEKTNVCFEPDFLCEGTDFGFHVLRCGRLLRTLGELVGRSASTKHRRHSGLTSSPGGAANGCGTKLADLLSRSQTVALLSSHLRSLVPVTVIVQQRGTPAERAMLCLPSEDDLRELDKDWQFGGPVEPLHPHKPPTREKLKQGSKKKRSNTGQQDTMSSMADVTSTKLPEFRAVTNALITTLSAAKVSTEQLTCTSAPQQQPLATKLTEQAPSLYGSTSRLIIGFLTNGSFDLSRGQGSGIGFCTLPGLLRVLRHTEDGQACLVLVRNPTSRQYRFAHLSVLD